MIKTLSKLTAAIVSISLLTNCSMLVSQGGKDMGRVFKPDTKSETIQRRIGIPTATVTYPESQKAARIPELKSLARWKKELNLETVIGSHEDYVYKGRVYNEDDAQGYAMVDALTFGAGEVFMFPLSISDAAKARRITHRYRVWYKPDGTYFAHIELVSEMVVPNKKQP